MRLWITDCGLHGFSMPQHVVLSRKLHLGLRIKKIPNQNKDEADYGW